MRSALSKKAKFVFGVLAPLAVSLFGFWLVVGTSTGMGPSVGGRAMVLLLVLFPVGFVIALALNLWVLFAPVRRRLSAFVLGAPIPALLVVLAYAYLWRIGPLARY